MNKQMFDLNGDIFIDFGCRLGQGMFGDVYKGISKSQNKLVAIKRIKYDICDALEMTQKQVQVMRQFKHQNVLGFLDLIKHKEGHFLVIDYCQGGNLQNQIQNQPIPELNCFHYFKSLVFGMVEINNLKHIHRDLKPQNILFDKNKILKICDFGLARKIIGDDINKMQQYSVKGTPLYQSPQVLNEQFFSGKCDVWSAGLILIQMLTQKCPLRGPKDPQSLMKYQRQVTSKTGHYVFQGNYNKWFKEVAAMMLVFDQTNRASFAQIKQKIEKDEKQVLQELGGSANFGNIDIVPCLQIDTTFLLNIGQNNLTKQNNIYNYLLNFNRQEKLLNTFQLYLKYQYNKAKIFVNTASRLFQIQTPLNRSIILIVLYLAIGFYIKTIEHIENIFKNKEYKLPNGDIVNIHILQKLHELYSQKLASQKQMFYPTITYINQQINFGGNYTAFSSEQNLSALTKQLQKLSRRESKFTHDDFLQMYVQFIKSQCLGVSNAELKREEFGRLYWMALMLTNLQSVFPVKQFTNRYIINRVVDNCLKTEYNTILKRIEELRAEILSK